MLSYRHGFHAGNHADVLKHIVLLQCLQYLVQKDKPLLYIDSHAGTGNTALYRSDALVNQEYMNGIGKLFGQRFGVPAIDDYLGWVERLQADKRLSHYPGSAAFAHALLRPHDRLCLAELHPRDYVSLSRWAKRQEKATRIRTLHQDGFQLPHSLLPPLSRRALLLIDPAYEVKTDYRQVQETVAESLRRLPSATIIVWIPLVARREAQVLAEKLPHLCDSFLLCRLQLEKAIPHRLFGSVVYVANPPYTLANQLKPVLPLLAQTLGGEETRHSLNFNNP